MTKREKNIKQQKKKIIERKTKDPKKTYKRKQ